MHSIIIKKRANTSIHQHPFITFKARLPHFKSCPHIAHRQAFDSPNTPRKLPHRTSNHRHMNQQKPINYKNLGQNKPKTIRRD